MGLLRKTKMLKKLIVIEKVYCVCSAFNCECTQTNPASLNALPYTKLQSPHWRILAKTGENWQHILNALILKALIYTGCRWNDRWGHDYKHLSVSPCRNRKSWRYLAKAGKNLCESREQRVHACAAVSEDNYNTAGSPRFPWPFLNSSSASLPSPESIRLINHPLLYTHTQLQVFSGCLPYKQLKMVYPDLHLQTTT